MENFIAIVKSTDGKLDKYLDFAVEADAVSHVEQYGGFVVSDSFGALGRISTSYWIVNEVGQSVTIDQAQADADILASNWERLRAERDALLDSSDWTQYNDSPLTDEVKTDWATYRQELRDLPDITDDPTGPTWPEVPE